MASSGLEEFTAPGFVEGLPTLPLTEIRSRRQRATEAETGLSYLRRLVQGHLDIVLAEQHRRDAGEAAGDIADLVDRLPEILGDHARVPGLGRLPTLMAPSSEAMASGRLEAIVPPDRLGSLPGVPDAELADMSARLDHLEREVSTERRRLHEVLDRLQEEIVRRYRTGEASVDSLLK